MKTQKKINLILQIVLGLLTIAVIDVRPFGLPGPEKECTECTNTLLEAMDALEPAFKSMQPVSVSVPPCDQCEVKDMDIVKLLGEACTWQVPGVRFQEIPLNITAFSAYCQCKMSTGNGDETVEGIIKSRWEKARIYTLLSFTGGKLVVTKTAIICDNPLPTGCPPPVDEMDIELEGDENFKEFAEKTKESLIMNVISMTIENIMPGLLTEKLGENEGLVENLECD